LTIEELSFLMRTFRTEVHTRSATLFRSPLDVLCQSLFDKLDLATLQTVRSELAARENGAFPAYERHVIGNAIAELDGMVVARLAKSLHDGAL
jgi:hypothetical protein